MEQLEVINEISAQLQELIIEAFKTHGVAATMTALQFAAAKAVHDLEHIEGSDRAANLGYWTSGFHGFLMQIHNHCDRQQEFRGGKDQLSN
jgi:hypothetical protein